MTARYGKDFVVVGTVVKPHGIRGEFCIKSFADSPFLFDEVPQVFLDTGKKRPKPLSVKAWRMHKSMVLMTAAEVPDRNAAEELRGMDVLVRTDDLPEIEDGDFYLYELEGFAVSLEDGKDIGILSGFIEAPTQDIWVIATADGREVLLPGVPEFIRDVDPEAQRIFVDPPEGLLELYEKPEPKPAKQHKGVKARSRARGRSRGKSAQKSDRASAGKKPASGSKS
ncbi:ribosome maturation factor RimM [Pseudodesulfovibrio senegalensis]|uniref:Ribosome maturation factor RimM n=1 Tax=Pseudodesulfovibrio senegalensis TaxID=1721087 RepID=A0A6N6N5L5_9BACT|nr:ribosome maturation factor RimM [Pseudodesulfovibrio senegalensis]KAB1442769.1 16S rRNA processing protein RimM [Pseudodesulfovibrio senegalensis]